MYYVKAHSLFCVSIWKKTVSCFSPLDFSSVKIQRWLLFFFHWRYLNFSSTVSVMYVKHTKLSAWLNQISLKMKMNLSIILLFCNIYLCFSETWSTFLFFHVSSFLFSTDSQDNVCHVKSGPSSSACLLSLIIKVACCKESFSRTQFPFISASRDWLKLKDQR